MFAVHQPQPLRAAPLPAVRAPGPDAPVAPEAARPKARHARPDRDRGLSLLFSFTGALFVMVGDVVVIAAVEESWILIPGFAVLLLMTAIVFVGIIHLLADDGEDTTSDGR